MNAEFGFPVESSYYSTLYHSTVEVISDPRRFRLNNFLLTGKDGLSQKSQISIFEWLAIFPKQEGDYLGVAFVNQNNPERLRQFCSEITKLEIPERIKNLKINPDPSLVDNVTKQLAVNCRPSIIVTRGEDLQTHRRLMILFYPQGMPPQEALAFIQGSAKDKYWELTSQVN